MTRPHGIKSRQLKKRKRDNAEAPPPVTAAEEAVAAEAEAEEVIVTDVGGDADTEVGDGDEEHAETEAIEMAGIPVMKPLDAKKKPGVIFVLERASLEVAKVGKTFQILNSDDHGNYLKRQNRNPGDYRPDIVHQALLAILDSPLNQAGRLQALYVRTEKGVLIEIKPHTRLPRTFKRFSGLMLQLLQTLSISGSGKRGKLLNVIKNPVTQHLPLQSRKIGLSYSSPKVVQMRDYVAAASDDFNLVFVVGAMAHGKIDKEYADDFISISQYPLSAACCIGRICSSLEQKWKII